jgi:hypothetical protein
MNKATSRDRLEVLTNVAVLLVAVCLLAVLALNYLGVQKPAPRLVEGLQKGQQLPAIPGVDYPDATAEAVAGLAMDQQTAQVIRRPRLLRQLRPVKYIHPSLRATVVAPATPSNG